MSDPSTPQAGNAGPSPLEGGGASDPSTPVVDVDQADFQAQVVERSHDVPVVVDFWAAWCGPCRTLGPALESAVAARGGDVVLAKVDVDSNQALAQRYRVQGIPAVKAFRDGQVVAEFTGAVGPPQIEAFLDEVVPSEADRLVSAARNASPDVAEAHYRDALRLEPDHRAAALALAGLLVDRDPDGALELVAPHRPHPDAERIAARADLASSGGDIDALRAAADADPDDPEALIHLARALAASDLYEEAVDRLLDGVRHGGEVREPAREQLVSLFNVLGDDHPLVRQARPQLARALF